MDLFKLVYLKPSVVHTSTGKWVVGLLLKGLLVSKSNAHGQNNTWETITCIIAIRTQMVLSRMFVIKSDGGGNCKLVTGANINGICSWNQLRTQQGHKAAMKHICFS